MANQNNSGRNRVLVPEARKSLDQFKLEVANELGIANYDGQDKGNLSSRQNGYVGGYMVKKMIEQVQRNMTGK
ncbi:alpha/beta-type small acid-soluble spore protein [Irregularibacter muris]|uniref:Alpha/beta-type small acid-soluble spore protein n=1 Tax=Irregularibacter muris TaxID=1796619 RepID=A0AAE3L3F1_9FIRM|nr:alpha/beta-type small acid-soluble spore protein [Irregularibacter muris]MCR1898158.1 alpha/beta-type small acid-soluble spore protein [Irregularibacter muris]